MRIPISKPYFGEEEKKAVLEPLETGWVVQGPKVREFERLFEQFQGCRHAIATTSATTALHLALLSVGVKPGDEVIVPAFTHPATANVVGSMGAKPVFVDVRLQDFNIDPERIEERISKKTKAIVPVHLFGCPADMDPILELASRFDLKVVEDAACAHGAEYHGTMVGIMGRCGVFSFHPRKVITTGEGGMLTTNDELLAAEVSILRSHGESLSDEVRHRADEVIYPDYGSLGYNYRMTDLQAAVGTEQMRKLPHILRERGRIASRYMELLAELEEDGFVGLPRQEYGTVHVFQSFVILLKEKVEKSRDKLSNELNKIGIATRKGTYHVPGTRFYRETFGFRAGDFPNSEWAEKRSLAIPLYVPMTDEEVGYVVEHLRQTIR
jgi:dTDP-4-amino-4,6-dideoxygalactose transaminase